MKWRKNKSWLARIIVGFCWLAALLHLSVSRLHAQNQLYLPWVDNNWSGEDYFTQDVEIGGYDLTEDLGWGPITYGGMDYVDSSVTVNDEVFVHDSLTIANNLSVNGVFISSTLNGEAVNSSGTLSSEVDNLSLAGSLELFSHFSSGLSQYGEPAAASWLHASLDFGDLTYTGTDTPAFNVSESAADGVLLPIINFTGYDGNTTWIWQQNGREAFTTANLSMVKPQMKLTGAGNLALLGPDSDESIYLAQESGNWTFGSEAAGIAGLDDQADTFTLQTGNASINFTQAGSSTGSITPANVSSFQSIPLGLGFGSGISLVGANAMAFGNQLAAAYDGSVVVGQWNTPPTSSYGSGNISSWYPTDPLFVIGNGQGSDDPSDAMVVLKDGDTTINGNATVQGNATFNGNTAVFTNGEVIFSGNVGLAQTQGDIPMALPSN
jgi:hypothetical protein